MQIRIYSSLLLFFLINHLTAQRSSFSITVDKDTMYQDEVIKVEIKIDNMEGTLIQPKFKSFRIVSGPNSSSSFTMINGEVSQKQSYSYLLMPESPGVSIVGETSLTTEIGLLTTEPIHITVLRPTKTNQPSISNIRLFQSNKITEKDTSNHTNIKKRVLKKI